MQSISVRERTDVAEARRRVSVLALHLGYDQTQTAQVALVVTELAQNLVQHAGGGEILAGLDPQRHGGIEIMSLDRGPGMTDVTACQQDGYSTYGSSGNGLGAIKRLAQQVLIHSSADNGTAVLVRMGAANDLSPEGDRTMAELCVPKTGEDVCGDTAAIVIRPDGTIYILLADGLGHGPNAAAASMEAARLFRMDTNVSPKVMLTGMSEGLRTTRGAAVAIALIDPKIRQVTYSGIGNIAGFITDSSGVRHMVSHNGTVGRGVGRRQDFFYPIHNKPVLVMCSDGLSTSWSPSSHPRLFALDPLLIAGVLYRDYSRRRDDASVVVWKG